MTSRCLCRKNWIPAIWYNVNSYIHLHIINSKTIIKSITMKTSNNNTISFKTLPNSRVEFTGDLNGIIISEWDGNRRWFNIFYNADLSKRVYCTTSLADCKSFLKKYAK